MAIQQRRFRWRNRPRVQITRVGLWFGLFSFIIAVAASNTGNNALYMVVATMVSLLLLSVLSGYANIQGIEIESLPVEELFAGQRAAVSLRLSNRSRWLPKWLIQVHFVNAETGDPRKAVGGGALVSHLIRRRRSKVTWCEAVLDLGFERRGHRVLVGPTLSTLFPFGLFRVTRHLLTERALVVFPEMLEGMVADLKLPGASGEEAARRTGLGHDLYSLRHMRAGDDPRGIHWKQSARTGRLIFQQRAAEVGSRVSIIFDNGVPLGKSQELYESFERAVSEAATLAVAYLSHDFEVELITRDAVIPYCGGEQGRLQLLEALALVAPLEGDFDEPLQLGTGLSTLEQRFEIGFSEVDRGGSTGLPNTVPSAPGAEGGILSGTSPEQASGAVQR